MNNIETIVSRLKTFSGNAIYWQGMGYTYPEFIEIIDKWLIIFKEKGLKKQAVCAFYGDYSPMSCGLIFALMINDNMLMPLTPASGKEIPEYSSIAGVDWFIKFNSDDSFSIEESTEYPEKNELIEKFRKKNVPGLIVFTSGSTGKPKGILQDCNRVLNKFIDIRPASKTILFLMMDHFGGFNTLMSVFSFGGMAICLPDRNPSTVCEIIEKSKAELLPATPTFINILLSSNAYMDYDLSSIRLITYGTEMMPETTLQKIKNIFPNSRVKQTYGLSELGVLKSKSEKDESVWIKVGGKGFETKVVDNELWVRSEANMIGYLNAPTPIDSEGWMNTGDEVEVKGEYLRFLGRKSDIINVGGQKVFPAEVESVLLEDDNVAEAVVIGSPHQIMGKIVTAKITLKKGESLQSLSERLRKLCLSRLSRYKVPVKFTIVSSGQYNARFKKLRNNIS